MVALAVAQVPKKTGASRAAAVARAETGAAKPEVRDQLDRLLKSATFRQADRLKRFLTFIVTEALSGRGGDLKEYVIGVQVFRKEESFDPRTDPIVRVQARRLRAKLFHYYLQEGPHDALVIELPKGGYCPVFRDRDSPAPVKASGGGAIISHNTMAVRVFADQTPDQRLGLFCQGLRDEILHRLARLTGLRILAAPASEPGEAGDEGAAKTAAALIIGGSARVAGDRLRVSVHLIDSATDSYLWSESIDANMADAFDTQERVAQLVVRKVEPDLRQRGQHRPVGRSAENLAAQNLYRQGRYHLDQRTEEGLRKALDFFERALAEDSEYALASSGLADAYGLLAHYGVLGPAEAWTKAASRATSAVMLDDTSAEAHTSLAHVKATQDWDWAGAEREYQRAIRLDPRYPTAHHWYAASCLAPQGRLDEALDEISIAQSLDPVSSIVARDLAVIHFYRRNFDTALEQCDHTIELNPHFAPAYWILGVIQEQRRDFDESAAAFQRAVHLSPQTPRMHGALGRTFALSGRRKQALEVLRKLKAYAKERYVSPLEFAWIHFALGETDLGFKWLAEGVRGSIVRSDLAQGRSAFRSAPGRSAIQAAVEAARTRIRAAVPQVRRIRYDDTRCTRNLSWSVAICSSRKKDGTCQLMSSVPDVPVVPVVPVTATCSYTVVPCRTRQRIGSGTCALPIKYATRLRRCTGVSPSSSPSGMMDTVESSSDWMSFNATVTGSPVNLNVSVVAVRLSTMPLTVCPSFSLAIVNRELSGSSELGSVTFDSNESRSCRRSPPVRSGPTLPPSPYSVWHVAQVAAKIARPCERSATANCAGVSSAL